MKKPKILSVKIKHEIDEYPDTSWLGEYKSKPNGWYIDRKTGHLHDEADTMLAEGIGVCHTRDSYEYITCFQHPQTWNNVDDKGVHSAFLRMRLKGDGKRINNLFAKYGVIGWRTAQSREEKIRCMEAVYCCQDADRLESCNNGNFNFIGIIAKAQVQLPDSDIVQTIRSGGLWGIESDSDSDYIEQVEHEQLEELKQELEQIGIGKRAIEYAFKNKE